MTNSTPGRILFVGAGPGNPDLLTVRAREVLTSIADAWVDDGVGESIAVSWDMMSPSLARK